MKNLKFCMKMILTVTLNFVTCSSFALAQDVPSCVGKDEPGTVIVFTNGVGNPKREDAQKGLDALKYELRPIKIDKNKKRSSYLAYNHGDGLSKDLLEAFGQKFGDNNYYDFVKWASNLEIAPQKFKDLVQEISVKYLVIAPTVNEPRFKVHAAAISSLILSGKRIIHFSHSQGNFFANGVYSDLKLKGLHVNQDGKKVYENIQVASPTSAVLSGGPHFTYINDYVIKAVLFFNLNTTLLPNLAETGSEDGTRHKWIETYLSLASSAYPIQQAAYKAGQYMGYPSSTLPSGPITLTLTWGKQPDVDLHVYEPEGSHVYYNSEKGKSGFLDTDNTDGYGPEHYYVESCSTLQVGTYTLAANYYEGEGEEEATLFVQAGRKIKTIVVKLPTARDSIGNNSPTYMGKINVSKDSKTSEFSYEIL